jgi:uncharacterized membrane protein YccC
MSRRTRAAILSFLFPGLGHVYIGRFARGAIWFAGLLILSGVTGAETAQRWLTPVVALVLGAFAAADAAIVAPAEPAPRAE